MPIPTLYKKACPQQAKIRISRPMMAHLSRKQRPVNTI